MNQSFRLLAIAAVAVVLAGGCAPQATETIKIFEDPARVAKTYQRLLVVDVSADSALQAQFENEVVARLASFGVDAVPSHHTLDASNGLLQEDINRASEDLGTDGILVTHITSLDTTIDREAGREEILSTCRGGNPVDYFLYDRKVLAEPDTIKVAHTVAVMTNLYDSASKQHVWTIQSTCFDKASMEEVLLEEASAIVRQLRIDKLI